MQQRPYRSSISSTRPGFNAGQLIEALEPRLLFSASLVADAGPDLTVDEGQVADFVGNFADPDAPAGGFDETQVTADPANQQNLRLDGDRAIWDDGTDVFLYDATTGTTVNASATIASNVSDAQIDGDRIVFTGGGVHVYTISTGTTQTIGTSSSDAHAQIEGDTVIWERDNGAYDAIVQYDLATSTISLVNSFAGNQRDPVLDNGVAYWRQAGPSGFDYFAKNLTTGAVYNVSNTSGVNDQNLSADNGVLAWNTSGGAAFPDVYVLDARGFDGTGTLPAPTVLDPQGVFDINPAVSGTNVVWESVNGSLREIFAYNVDTGVTTNLSNSASVQEANPHISGDSVVWQVTSGGAEEIFLYDLADATLLQVSTNSLTDTLPVVSGDNIAWLGKASSGAPNDVFFATATSAVTYEFDWDFGDGTVLTGATLNESHAYADNGTYTVTLTVRGSDGFDATDTAQVTVDNVDPTLGGVALSAASVDEGGSVTLTGSFSDAGSADTHTVTIDWGDGTSSNAVVDQVAGTFSADHTYLDDAPSGTASDLAAISVTLADDDAGTDTAAESITVNNLAPVAAAISGPAQGVRGQTLSYSASFTDAGVLDTHTQTWTITDAGGATLATGSGGSIDFTPADTGSYTVAYTVTDDDTGSDGSTLVSTVGVILVTADPADPGQTALLIGGSNDADRIRVYGRSAGLTASVYNYATGQYDVQTGITGVDQIIAYGQDGNDSIKLYNSVGTTPATLFGGDGNDWIRGGKGDDAIVGGTGNDFIAGADGRDLLVGGEGSDLVIGHKEDDILVAGNYVGQYDLPTLRAIMAEWTRTDLGYAGRVANLTTGGGLNGSATLNDTNVSDDGQFDLLLGLQGQDWFLANDDQDLTDQRRNELLTETEVDFLDSELEPETA